ncbi:MAG: carbohydrate binding family 9 domain-containing protein [Candidatus Glassbacteria bacterium]|nr:carbohydrate binding family 9 domain-containing protein [Candidatus Glassbacteria bacterium]
MRNLVFVIPSVLLVLFLVSGLTAFAQDTGQFPRRSITAIEAETPPVIDGRLDDPIWQAADWQTDFSQLKPDPGAEPRAITRVAIGYDSEHIYTAFRCFNPTGSSANSKITARDGNMDQDNAVTLYLDTYHTRRDCYYFSTNSLGTQVDGRIGEDGAANDKKWDCPWTVASFEDSVGWSCEMKIPVSEMRIPRGEGLVWGINFRRNYPELFETSFWQHRDVAWRISQSGDLHGLPAFDKLFSATLYPYMVGLDSNQPSAGRRTIASSGGSELIGGADLRLKLGNSLDGNLTWNPDFATVEADLTIINLTRYETFFPEKRLYFLEGAELFSNPINVFYSRRIGDIDWGVKTNGRLGKFNYAVLGADERATGDDPAAHTEVVRLQRDIFGSSNIGLTAVSRSWDGGYARVLSTDGTLNLTTSTRLRGQFVGSFPSDGEDIASASSLRLSYNKGLYVGTLGYVNFDPGFRENVNQVGFIPDDDHRDIFSWFSGEHWIRRHGIEKISFNQGNDVSWRHSDALKLVRVRSWVGITFLANWLVGYGGNYKTELFEKRFRNHTQLVEGGWNQQSWNNVGLLHIWGRNFDRDFHRTRLRGAFKPLDNLSFSAGVTWLRFSPDTTGQGTELYDMSAVYNFTPNLWLSLTSQYNSNNDRLYLYGLFGWRFSPPFGALYIAYTADRFEMMNEQLARVVERRDRALFIKLTVPLSIY